ncbi:MAG: hypothetical protein ACI837_002554, partial [Crocinitomicaceae bacterium]
MLRDLKYTLNRFNSNELPKLSNIALSKAHYQTL